MIQHVYYDDGHYQASPVSPVPAYSIIPFRCTSLATIPPRRSNFIESIELSATCPEEWHDSYILHVSMK